MTEKASRKKTESRKAAPAGGEVDATAAARAEAGEETPADPQAAAVELVEGETPLEDLLAQRETEVADLQNQILYLHSELENFKKRTEKRYREALEFASEPLLKELLPVLDNLERAVDHGREAGIDPLLEGLNHVIQQFRESLGRHGVAPVPTEHEKFDPSIHEAMAQVPGAEDGRVGDVYEKGYMLKGRLLRPAKVTVTKVASQQRDG